MLKKILCVLMISMLFICTTTYSYAIDYNEDSINNIVSKYEYNDTLVYKVTNNKKIISSKNINQLLFQIGYTENEINTFSSEDINNIINCEEITISESYFCVSQDGEYESMNKQECLFKAKIKNQDTARNLFCLDKVDNANLFSINNTLNNSTKIDYSDDDYMKISTSSIYLSSGWYIIASTYTWLNTPKSRGVDIMSICAPELAWSQDNSQYFCGVSYTQMTSTSGSKTTVERMFERPKSLVKKSGGIYYSYDLPNDISYTGYPTYILKSCSDISITIRGKARVSDYTKPRAFNVFSTYGHSISNLGINPKISWSLGSYFPGVSFAVGKDKKISYYYGMNYTDYNP